MEQPMTMDTAFSEINDLKTTLGELRVMAEKQPEQYLPKVAGVCNNLGNLMADDGRFEEAGPLFSESLILHMVLWLQDREAYGNNLGIVLNSVRNLAMNPAFKQSGQWLGHLWGVVIYNLRSACLPFCREMGSLFESLEQWDLALEPYLFAELVLMENNPEQAAMARADVDRINEKLGTDTDQMCQAIKARLAEFTSTPSPQAGE
jgi:hypothetical protein